MNETEERYGQPGNPKKRSTNRFFLFRKNFWKGLILLTVLLLLFGAARSFLKEPIPVVEKGTFVEQIKDLSSLATAEAYVKAVIQKEDNKIFGRPIDKNFPGTKRKVLFIVPASVMAGIDLQNITEGDIQLNEEEKKLTIVLPHAEIIQAPVLYVKDIQAFSQEGLFRSEMDASEGFEFAAEANDIVIEEAIGQGLLDVAEKNAVTVLTQFFKQVGYELTVQFENK